MSYETIELLFEPPVATIRLNRPHRMNAVIEQMYLEIQNALARLVDDRGSRCLILTGSTFEREGRRRQAFCAGADLKEHAAGTRTAAQRRDYIHLAHATTRMLFELPLPTIASINGPARGAGTELALNCDFVVMATGATLALPEIGLGTFVGGGVTHVLPRLIGLARAKELVFTGRVLDGEAAVRYGLALRSCPLAELESTARALALDLAAAAPLSLRLAKRLLHTSPGRKPEQALDDETEAIVSCMQTDDWHEGVRAFAEKRPPVFEGK